MTDQLPMDPTAGAQLLPLIGGPVRIEGAVSLEETDGGILPWRLPVGDRSLFEPSLASTAAMPSGIRLSFVSDTETVALSVRRDPDEEENPPWVFDLVVDGQLHQRVAPVRDAKVIRFMDLPRGVHHIELYLPCQYVSVTLRALHIDTDALASARVDERPRVIFYGSSITHCRHAAGPSETWPAIVARDFNLHLTSLGYGGNCHMDPMVGRMIRDLPAAAIGMKIGINMIGAASVSDRTFRALAIGLLKTIRDGHPTTPIAVISPIFNSPREDKPNSAGMTLQLARQRLAEAVDVLKQEGDANLHYVNGLDLMGPDHVHLYEDGTHPNAEGYRFFAKVYGEVVMPKLGFAHDYS